MARRDFVFGGAALRAWAWPLSAVPAMGAAEAAIATSLVAILQVAILARAVRALPLPGGLHVPRRPELRASVSGRPIAPLVEPGSAS